jgi:dihydrofolate reductase
MRCSVFIATSLDGFIARSDGRIDWLSRVERPGEDYGYGRFFASVDTLIIGRNTYETARGFDPWPYAGKRCVVLTHRAIESAHGEEPWQGTPADLVSRLTADGAKHAYVDGGSVVQQFLAAGLVNELTLSIVPVLLGSGVRLFGALGGDLPLRLIETRSFESGLVPARYQL